MDPSGGICGATDWRELFLTEKWGRRSDKFFTYDFKLPFPIIGESQ